MHVRDPAAGPAASSSASRAYTGHTAPITGVGASATGALLASASLDGSVRVWTAATGPPVPSVSDALLCGLFFRCQSYSLSAGRNK